MQTAVRDHSDALNIRIRDAFKWPYFAEAVWVSPIQEDQYAEYRDKEFLERLGLGTLRTPLHEFWPRNGPCWDALAIVPALNKVLLVEAKAHISEGLPDAVGAVSPGSSARILCSLQQAKQAFGASEKANWEAPFYQYANRLAHLWFLRELNGIDASLLFLYFADAPDTTEKERTTSAEWQGAKRVFEKGLGLAQAHTFQLYVKTVIWSVPEMLNGTVEQGA